MQQAMDNHIGLKELREHTERYIKRVRRGDSFVVFRRSEPVFKLSPANEDDNLWETVVDFTKINTEGVPARDVLKALARIHGAD